ncbi:MAG: 2,3-bisphosphoglycerate-independent phosphoglycerate mutase [Clostridia bacterium]
MKKTMTALIIMDGYGLAPNCKGNCIGDGSLNIKYLMENYPHSTLDASGLSVGLPDGQMGNSEVGHLNIGAGRVVYQELTRITKSIDDGDFFNNESLLKAVLNAKNNGAQLHLMGLCSDGGVHSHLNHLYALLKLCKMHKLEKVFVHCYMDGRDVSPNSGIGFVTALQQQMEDIGVGSTATVCGRYYAMDRDNRWDRVEKAYNMLTLGEGKKETNATTALKNSYDNGVTDEFILPTVIIKNNEPISTINDNDSIIFFNFRPDRARELTRALTQGEVGFKQKKLPKNLTYVCFTQYDLSFKGIEVAFKPQTLSNTLGEFLDKNNLTQLRIAETEKYAHVTFFFNGGVEKANNNETRLLINSPTVATYDLQPEMSAFEVTAEAIKQIKSGLYDVMILNFANCDMVGHTGVIDATKKAVETVDTCVKSVLDAILEENGNAFITADHGNAEKLIDDDGTAFTAHTTNAVPFIFVSKKAYHNNSIKLLNGSLCDIAPTMLEIIGLKPPKEMTGISLFEK